MKLLRLAAICLTVMFAGLFSFAEDDDFSPWEAWRQGYVSYQRGEQARDRGDFVQALKDFREAQKNYRAVQQARPDWNQKVIRTRLELCVKELDSARKLLGRPGVSSATEKTPDSEDIPVTPAPQRSAGDSSSGGSDTSRIKTETEQYKQRLFGALVELEDLRKQAARSKAVSTELENLMRERRVLQEKYNLLEKRYRQLEAKSAEPTGELNAQRKKLVELQINLETVTRKLELANENIAAGELETAKLNRDRVSLTKSLEKAMALAEKTDTEIAALQRYKESATGEKNNWLQKEKQLNVTLAKAEKLAAIRLNEIDTLNRRLHDLSQKDGEKGALNAEVSTENQKLRQATEKLRTELEETIADKTKAQNKLRELQLEMTDLRGVLQRIDDRRTQAELENKMFVKQIDKLVAASDIAGNELKNLRLRNIQLNTNLKTWVEKYEKIQKRLNDRDAAELASVTTLNSERRKLNEEIAKGKVENADLAARLENLQKQLKNGEKNNSRLRDDLLAQKASLLSAEQELKKLPPLREENEKLTAANNELKDNLAAAARQLVMLKNVQKQLTGLESEKKNLAEKLAAADKLREQISRLERTNQELSDSAAQVALLRQENRVLNELKKEHLALRLQIAKAAETDKENIKLKADLQTFNEQQKLLAVMQGSLKQLPLLQADKKQLQQNIAAMNAEKKTLNSTLSELREQLKSLQQDYAANQTGAAAKTVRQNAELTALQKELSEVRKKADSAAGLSASVAVWQKKYAEVAATQVAAGEERAKLQKSLAAERQNNVAWQEKLSGEQKNTAALQKAIAVAKQKTADAEKTVAENHKTTAALQQEAAALREENRKIAAINATIPLLNKEIELLRTQNKTYLAKLPAAAELSKQIAALQKNNHELQLKIADHDAVSRRNTELTAANTKLSAEIATRQKSEETQKTANAELQKANAALQNNNAAQHKSDVALTAATAELRAARDSIAALKKEQLQTSAQLAAWQKTAQEQTAGIEKLQKMRQDELPALTGKLADTARQLAALQDEKQKLLAAGAANAARQKQQQNTIADLRKQLSATRSPDKSADTALQRQLDTARRRVAELEKEFTALDTVGKNRRIAELEAQLQKYAGLEKNLNLVKQQNAALNSALAQVATRPATGAAATPLPPLVMPQTGKTRINAPQMLANAAKAEKNSDIPIAIWNYDSILAEQPDNFAANLRLGQLLMREEKFNQAVKYLQKAYLLAPADQTALLAYAQVQLSSRKFGNAIALLDKAAAPLRAEYAYMMTYGRACVGAGKTPQAEEFFRRSAQRQPDSSEPCLELARLLCSGNAERKNEAASFYGKAKKMGATPDPMLESTLGKMLNDRSELIDFLTSAAREAETHNDYASAVWYYSQLLDMDREAADFAAKLAFYQLRTGKIDAARKTLEKFSAGSDILLLRAFTSYFAKEYPQTVAAAKELLRANNNKPHKLVKEHLWLLGELDKAPPDAAAAVGALRAAVLSRQR